MNNITFGTRLLLLWVQNPFQVTQGLVIIIDRVRRFIWVLDFWCVLLMFVLYAICTMTSLTILVSIESSGKIFPHGLRTCFFLMIFPQLLYAISLFRQRKQGLEESIPERRTMLFLFFFKIFNKFLFGGVISGDFENLQSRSWNFGSTLSGPAFQESRLTFHSHLQIATIDFA